MARYKAIDTSPRFLAVDQEKQLLPGSFEHAVHHLIFGNSSVHITLASRIIPSQVIALGIFFSHAKTHKRYFL